MLRVTCYVARVPIHPILVQQKIPGDHDGDASDAHLFVIKSVPLVEEVHHHNRKEIVPTRQQEKTNDLRVRQGRVSE